MRRLERLLAEFRFTSAERALAPALREPAVVAPAGLPVGVAAPPAARAASGR
jgi:hypothetical protein